MNTYEIITERIIKALETNDIPWRKPWSHGESLGSQRNLVTGHRYRGINAFLTYVMGYEKPLWLTFKQAKDIWAQVRKGEKATPVVYWITIENEDESKFMIPKYYSVFNVAQCDGIDLSKYIEIKPVKEIVFNPIETAEKIDREYRFRANINVLHQEQRAYYSAGMDYVNMPKPETFESVEKYYAVLFHELTHSTGHETRLKREIKNLFGDHKYSKEELVAELGAAFLCSRAKIDSPQLEEQHVSYIQNWVKVLRNDPKLIIHASAQAQKAVDWILNEKQEYEKSERGEIEKQTVSA